MSRHKNYVIVLAFAVTLAMLSCDRRPDQATRMPNDEGSKAELESDDEPYVLGQQFADAHEAETKWRESGGGGNSPLPDKEYDSWRGDLSLIHPTPSPLDDEIRSICRQYARSNADDRSGIRHSISMDQFYSLINFAKRSAVFGVRENRGDLVADSLTAIAMIEQDRVDFRDILMCLGLLYHAANRAGGNADEMFRNAAALAEPEVAEFFVNFAEQTPEYRSLRESWGYDEVLTADGLGFIGWGFSAYNPSVDLKSVILDISELVVADYRVDSIEVATDLPGVWLGGQSDDESERVLTAVRAGASIHARLRPDKHPEYSSQRMMVFLVEAASESDAQWLSEMAQGSNSPICGRLALARSRLFCLVIGRSFSVGVDDYETDESLERFSDGLAAILERHVRLNK